MMNCEQATRLMSDSRERTLTLRERAAIKVHNLLCDGCKNFNVQVQDLGQIARRYARERDDSQAKTSHKPEQPRSTE